MQAFLKEWLSGDTVRSIAIKLQISQLCAADKFRCLLSQDSDTGARDKVWHYFDVVEEAHASHFQFRFESLPRACVERDLSEVTSLMQRPAWRHDDSTLFSYTAWRQ